MSRYQREDWPGRAHAIIRNRVCALPEFAHARGLVVSQALDECQGLTVAELRERGGFSGVIRRHIDALPDCYRQEYGSRLYPHSVVDVLRGLVPQMREELQFALAAIEGEVSS